MDLRPIEQALKTTGDPKCDQKWSHKVNFNDLRFSAKILEGDVFLMHMF